MSTACSLTHLLRTASPPASHSHQAIQRQQGLLIGQKRTGEVRTAMGANLLTLIGVLVIGIRQSTVPGSLLAASGMMTGLLTEASLLWWKASHRS